MNALVLGGGGAKGAYQVGAWQALNELNQSFEIVTGTSVGALNAALYVQGDFDVARKLWSEMTIDQMVKAEGDILERLVNYDITGKDFKQLIGFFAQTISQNGLDISPMREKLEYFVDEKKVRQSHIKLGIVTFSLTDFKPLELSIDQIPEGQLHDYLIASSSLPVFKLERKFGKLMIDGGFYDNLPINLAERMGGTSITAIDLKAIGVNRPFTETNKRIISSVDDIGGVLEVSPQKAMRNMSLGYYDTLRSYHGYHGYKYYIKDGVEAMAVIDKFQRIDKAACHYLKQLLMTEEIDDMRFIFEELLPELANTLGLKQAEGYDQIYLRLLEKIAESLGIERFKLWTIADFEAAIEAQYQAGNIFKPKRKIIRKLITRINMISEENRIKFYNTIYEKIAR